MFQITQATRKIRAIDSRVRVVQGGTSAGKTIGILQHLIDLAQRDKKPRITSVVSESFPHLKRGAIRDFLAIMQDCGYFKDSLWNKTDYTYTFESGSRIEFFSADQPGKVRGPRRDRLFINEANNVSFEAFEQLEVRTKQLIFLDFNPVSSFWVFDDVLGKRDDAKHLIVTYKDNEALDPAIVSSIEQRMNRKGWWKVYGEGLLGEVEGKIYRDWQIIDEIPHEARLERFGLDFGYSNDPAAIVAVYYYNGGYILDEICFQKGLFNRQLADLILSEEHKALTIGDSAEPKSIDEIRECGVSIMGVDKAKGETRDQKFVNWSIKAVQSQRISVTKRSVNIIKEYRNYLWETDNDGNILDVPEHTFSHSMDAIRYAIASIIRIGLATKASDYVPPPPFLGEYEGQMQPAQNYKTHGPHQRVDLVNVFNKFEDANARKMNELSEFERPS